MGQTAMKGGVHEDSNHEGGNSVSVGITASVIAAAALSIDQAVEISEQDGHTIIEPIRAPRYDLERLVEQMTPDPCRDALDFGRPVGGEAGGRSGQDKVAAQPVTRGLSFRH